MVAASTVVDRASTLRLQVPSDPVHPTPADDLTAFLRYLEALFAVEARKRSGGINDLRKLGHGKVYVTFTLYNGRFTLSDFLIGSQDQPERK